MVHAKSFRDLQVYQKAFAVSHAVFALLRGFPREEMYALTDQVRASARSMGAQLAEAWGKRLYERHFVSKLTDADAEQLETQHWVDVAVDSGYLTADTAAQLRKDLESIGRMLHSMITKAHLFCGAQKPRSGEA